MAEDVSEQPDLMTSKEVAECLRLPLPTVYYLARNEGLPAFQVGRRWRFPRHEIESIKAAEAKPPPRVLVIDDEPAICELLSEALSNRGCVVHTASGVDAALALTAQFKFDALLVDLMLGNGCGTDFIEAVKGEYSLRQMIIITGYPDLLDTAPLLKLGPITVVKKPFLPSQIIECVEQICGRPLGGST